MHYPTKLGSDLESFYNNHIHIEAAGDFRAVRHTRAAPIQISAPEAISSNWRDRDRSARFPAPTHDAGMPADCFNPEPGHALVLVDLIYTHNSDGLEKFQEKTLTNCFCVIYY